MSKSARSYLRELLLRNNSLNSALRGSTGGRSLTKPFAGKLKRVKKIVHDADIQRFSLNIGILPFQPKLGRGGASGRDGLFPH